MLSSGLHVETADFVVPAVEPRDGKTPETIMLHDEIFHSPII